MLDFGRNRVFKTSCALRLGVGVVCPTTPCLTFDSFLTSYVDVSRRTPFSETPACLLHLSASNTLSASTSSGQDFLTAALLQRKLEMASRKWKKKRQPEYHPVDSSTFLRLSDVDKLELEVAGNILDDAQQTAKSALLALDQAKSKAYRHICNVRNRGTGIESVSLTGTSNVKTDWAIRQSIVSCQTLRLVGLAYKTLSVHGNSTCQFQRGCLATPARPP